MNNIRVLFVCMGNICRSPTAHVVFQKRIDDAGLSEHVQIDSAGTHAYHAGKPPDGRSQEVAIKRGLDMSDLIARQINRADFSAFDYVLAMDSENYDILMAICPPEYQSRLSMFLEYAPHLGMTNVPDPYYGGARGFELVFDLIETAAEGLLTDIQRKLAL